MVNAMVHFIHRERPHKFVLNLPLSCSTGVKVNNMPCHADFVLQPKIQKTASSCVNGSVHVHVMAYTVIRYNMFFFYVITKIKCLPLCVFVAFQG